MAEGTLDRIIWRTPQGEAVSCVEKIRVLTETLGELRQVAQDAFEDALVIGCEEAQVRAVLQGLLAGLVNPYRRG